MVRNINGGCKTKSRARKDITDSSSTSREIRLPTNELEYIAYVNKACGDGRFDVILSDGEKNSCIVRGKHKGKGKRNNLVTIGSLILVGLREWENPRKTSDLICIYSPYEIENIKRMPSICLSNFPSDSIDNDNDLFSNECYDDIPKQVIKTDINNIELSCEDDVIDFDDI
jgi:translation initiation factor IF-1